MVRILYLVIVLGVTVGCGKKDLEHPTDAFHTARRLGRMLNGDLSEASGLAASKSNPGLFWMINDSGNDAHVILIDTAMNVHMTCELQGIENRDWEDLVAGPGPDSSRNYLYVAEIGDNLSRYPYKHIYRFEEPVLSGTPDGDPVVPITAFDTLTFTLPDGPKDTEALFMDRRTRDLYLVSKREKPVYLYRITYPYSTRDTLTAAKVMALPLTTITAADLSPDSRDMVMKNYEYIYYWHSDKPVSIVNLLAQQPLEVPYVDEPQGEAMTWSLDNSGFYTLSERPLGSRVYMYFYERK